jgi:hypothetical protein
VDIDPVLTQLHDFMAWSFICNMPPLQNTETAYLQNNIRPLESEWWTVSLHKVSTARFARRQRSSRIEEGVRLDSARATPDRQEKDQHGWKQRLPVMGSCDHVVEKVHSSLGRRKAHVLGRSNSEHEARTSITVRKARPFGVIGKADHSKERPK